jgi:hypothetical protein
MNKQTTLGLTLGSLLAVGLCLTTPVASLSAPPPPPGGDARTPIDALPFTIDTCGSYYLAGCLTGASGQHGIDVTADDVTIDLNGFTLTGVPGSLDGIHVTSDRFKLHDGFIRDWGGNGVGASGLAHHIESVRLRDNGASGIISGQRGVVRMCISRNNDLHGIVAGHFTLLDRNISTWNELVGFIVGSHSTVKHNIGGRNGNDGISATAGVQSIFKDNALVLNDNEGLDVGHDHLITDNVCYSNGPGGFGTGIKAGDGCYVDGNVTTFNGYGINAPEDFDVPVVVTRNCSVSNSSGNYAGLGSDDFGPIGSAATSSSPWSNISQ